MGEMADQQIEDGMLTPCDYCGAYWPYPCKRDCETRKKQKKPRPKAKAKKRVKP